MTTNKLPEWRKALNKSVENYQSAQAWYEENQDSPSAEQDVDTAAGEIEKLLKQYGVLIVLSLLDEIAELQEHRAAVEDKDLLGVIDALEHPAGINAAGKQVVRRALVELQEIRRSYLALRGEIEDVQSQLYEADNQANEYAAELQERRKADNAEPVADVVVWSSPNEERICDIRWRRFDVAPGPLYSAPPAPVVPPAIEPEYEVIKAILPTANPDEYACCIAADMWNACRAAMLQAGNSPVTPDGSEDTKRLDWLDAQNKRLNEYYGTSYGWKFDANFQRNAMMLNDSNYPVMNVRQAIDEAIAEAPKQENI
ncbi:hypothetical protein [Citrobacter freundii]|uniref:hypothetical protein n=1 Tax=Citrobacter freundii TaxID=546 RepID=UPI002E0DD5A1